MIKNGVIVQDLSSPAFSLKKYKGKYLGINSFWANPLSYVNEEQCKKLSEEVFHKKNSDGSYTLLEFISNPTLLLNYILKCKELNIDIRVLQVESDYLLEESQYEFPVKRFIGYELCEIPFDSQVITDFDWYKPFHRFYKNLNEYGLFDNLEDALAFKKAYEFEFQIGNIGDGEIDLFVCKICEIDIDTFIDCFKFKEL